MCVYLARLIQILGYKFAFTGHIFWFLINLPFYLLTLKSTLVKIRLDKIAQLENL